MLSTKPLCCSIYILFIAVYIPLLPFWPDVTFHKLVGPAPTCQTVLLSLISTNRWWTFTMENSLQKS